MALILFFQLLLNCSLATFLLGCNSSAEAHSQKTFLLAVQERFATLPTESEPVKYRIFKEYGALWVNNDEQVLLPANVVFLSAKETESYQRRLKFLPLAQTNCVLQMSAAKKLEEARQKAQKAGLALSPRGDDACLRSYETTQTLWLSRVLPNLAYYQKVGKLTAAEVNKVRVAKTWDQVAQVLNLETVRGLPFDKYRQTSILNSVAAPGSSQHLTGLAFDLAQYAEPKVRKIMNEHGWYQTVQNDLPHFTYLGPQNEASLQAKGLKKVVKEGYVFWVPDL